MVPSITEHQTTNRLRSTCIEMPQADSVSITVGVFLTGKLHSPTIPSSQGASVACLVQHLISTTMITTTISHVPTLLPPRSTTTTNPSSTTWCYRATITQTIAGSPRKPSDRENYSRTWDQIREWWGVPPSFRDDSGIVVAKSTL